MRPSLLRRPGRMPDGCYRSMTARKFPFARSQTGTVSSVASHLRGWRSQEECNSGKHRCLRRSTLPCRLRGVERHLIAPRPGIRPRPFASPRAGVTRPPPGGSRCGRRRTGESPTIRTEIDCPSQIWILEPSRPLRFPSAFALRLSPIFRHPIRRFVGMANAALANSLCGRPMIWAAPPCASPRCNCSSA